MKTETAIESVKEEEGYSGELLRKKDGAVYTVKFVDGDVVGVDLKYPINPTDKDRKDMLGGHSVKYEISPLVKVVLTITDHYGNSEIGKRNGITEIYLSSEDIKPLKTVKIGEFEIEFPKEEKDELLNDFASMQMWSRWDLKDR